MNSIRKALYAILIAILSGACSAATNSRATVDQLVDRSDTIVVGRTSAMTPLGHTEVDGIGADVESMQVEVLRVVKGDLSSRSITFTFILPRIGIGYHGVPPKTTRVIFLNHSGSKLEVANPYLPSLPACPSFHSVLGEVRVEILQYVFGALNCDELNEGERLEALDFLRAEPSPPVTAALQGAVVKAAGKPVLSLSIVAELLRRNDVKVLPQAQLALETGVATLPRFVYDNLAYAIGEIHSEDAIPTLATMLTVKDPIVRRSVSGALRNSQSLLAVKPLSRALWDEDFSVRYNAVIGLAEITKQSEWRPLEETFRSDEQKYLDYWRRWAKQTGSVRR